ncbi:MAG: TetR/AcrR family transcriptional regulator [Candidatus Binatia bacterium]
MALETAARAFNERGFYRTSLDDIAAELNVTKAALYYYFESKDEILYECHSLAIQSITEGPAGEDDEAGSGLDKIERLVRRYVAMIVQSFGRCLVLVGTQPLEKQNAAKCRAGRRRINDLLVGLIREGIADGSIAPCDPKLAAYFIFGTLNWIAQWYDENGPRTLEEIADQAVGYVLGGLAAPRRRASAADDEPAAERRRRRRSRNVS